MPLIVLGLIVMIGLLIMSVIRYVNEFHPTKDDVRDKVEERVATVFRQKRGETFRKDGYYRAGNDDKHSDTVNEEDADKTNEKILYFPSVKDTDTEDNI